MIEAIIILAVLVAWGATLIGTVYCWAVGSQLRLKIIFSITSFMFTAWLISLAIEHENEYPCLEYETTMMYNSATKTMMPVRSCKKRGEWVKE